MQIEFIKIPKFFSCKHKKQLPKDTFYAFQLWALKIHISVNHDSKKTKIFSIISIENYTIIIALGRENHREQKKTNKKTQYYELQYLFRAVRE